MNNLDLTSQTELYTLLAIVNYLVVAGLKDLASWLHIKVAEERTVVLAGLTSALIVALITIYGYGHDLNVRSIVHWAMVYAVSIGVYQTIKAKKAEAG